MLFSIAYISFAAAPFARQDLRELLTVARAHNTRLAVTGMLLYKDGHFMQVLEGRSPSVHLVFTRIERDPRHHSVQTIVREPIQEREFPDWSMGFSDLNSLDMRGVPGYSEFLNSPLTAAEFADVGRRRKLLGLFKRRL